MLTPSTIHNPPCPWQVDLSNRALGLQSSSFKANEFPKKIHMEESLQKRWETLLGSAMETIVNQLLYARHVYPRETFGAMSFLGVRCRVNRHPDVVSYIQESIDIAVPSMLAGASSEFSVIICETDSLGKACKDLEEFALRIEWPTMLSNEDFNSSQAILAVERSMRDVVLSILSLKPGCASNSGSVSFRVVVHISQSNKSCPEVHKAFSEGRWTAQEMSGETNGTLWPMYQSSEPFKVDLTLRRYQQQETT